MGLGVKNLARNGGSKIDRTSKIDRNGGIDRTSKIDRNEDSKIDRNVGRLLKPKNLSKNKRFSKIIKSSSSVE